MFVFQSCFVLINIFKEKKGRLCQLSNRDTNFTFTLLAKTFSIRENFSINQLLIVRFRFFIWNGYLLSFVVFEFLCLNLWLFVEIFNNTLLLNIIFS